MENSILYPESENLEIPFENQFSIINSKNFDYLSENFDPSHLLPLKDTQNGIDEQAEPHKFIRQLPNLQIPDSCKFVSYNIQSKNPFFLSDSDSSFTISVKEHETRPKEFRPPPKLISRCETSNSSIKISNDAKFLTYIIDNYNRISHETTKEKINKHIKNSFLRKKLKNTSNEGFIANNETKPKKGCSCHQLRCINGKCPCINKNMYCYNCFCLNCDNALPFKNKNMSLSSFLTQKQNESSFENIRDANFKKSLNFDNLNFHDNLVKRNENLQRFSLKSINEISFVPHPLQKIIPDKILQNNLINDDDSIWTDKDTLGTMSNEEDSHLRKTQFLRTKKKICKIKNFNSLQNF